MTSFDMSGNYDYASLRRTLKDKGLKESQLSAALSQIASQNHIDNIQNLDKSQSIVIPASVFNLNGSMDATSPFALPFGTQTTGAQQVETLPFIFSQSTTPPVIKEDVLPTKIISDGDNLMKLPEIFKEDDYEVADYDDYYGFGTPETTTEAATDKTAATAAAPTNAGEQKIDFNQFSQQYGKQFVTDPKASEQEKHATLQQMFGMLDVNSDNFLTQSELSAAFSLPVTGMKDETKVDTLPTEGEDPLGSAMMSSDMSGDSFNPQG